jgi:hypothetical protein
VAALVRFPHIMAAHPSLPAKTVAKLIALARSSPDKVNVASYGTGTTSHLAGELFKSLAGIDFVRMFGEPAVKARFEVIGVLASGSTPEELAAEARADTELWGRSSRPPTSGASEPAAEYSIN